jgi:hypothetical protein
LDASKVKKGLQMVASNREEGGELVRLAWIRWAKQQPQPKASWLVSWENLPEPDREADRQIWDAVVAPYNDALTEIRQENKALREAIDKYTSEAQR